MCICHGVMWWVESILLWQWQCNCIYTHAWDLQLRERDRGSAFKRDSKSQASHKGINLPRPQRKTRKLKRRIWVSMVLLDRKCRLKIQREVVHYRIQHMQIHTCLKNGPCTSCSCLRALSCDHVGAHVHRHCHIHNSC